MFLIKMAFRNLARHKKRTIYTAVVIAVAIGFYVFADALVLGMMDASYENVTEFEYGHTQITSQKYWEEREEYPLEDLIKVDERIHSKIMSNSEVVGTSPRLDFNAELNDGQMGLPVVGRGIDVSNEKSISRIDKSILKGGFITEGESEAVMGQNLANDMLLDVGDSFMLVVRTREKTFNVIDLTISGLFETPNPQINNNFVFVPIEIAQNALGVGDNYSHLAIKLTDRSQTENTTLYINSLLKNENSSYRAYSWEEAAEDLIKMQEYSDAMLYLMLGIILLLAVVGIINTVILSILERLKEIGMMKAMGMQIKEITFVLALEAGGIGVIGGIIGCLLGGLGVYLLSTFGINIYAGMEGEFDLPISMAIIYGNWNYGAFIFVFTYSIIVSFIVGLIPAYRGARIEPAELLHHK